MRWSDYDAVLFDLDGVITPTAEIHMRAWSEMFNAWLAAEHPEQPAYTDADYYAQVDGKPRYDGVRDFLRSRGISASEDVVRELGDRKNEAFNRVLERDGVQAYPGSVRLLDALRDTPLAVVSSSVNAPAVLRSAGLLGRFAAVVSGAVAQEHQLRGKPAPDTFLFAAQELGAEAERAVVVEDAVSGVAAGHAGGFGAVVGVDRGAGADALAAAGATVVVHDLAELVPGASAASGGLR